MINYPREIDIVNVIHHEPHGRASRIVEYNGVLYFEIHAPAAAAEKEMTMYEQAQALLRRYDELLEQYGSDKRHVLRAEIILRNASDLDEFNRAWTEWVEEGYQPARVTHTGLILPESILLGIVITAAKRDV